MTEVERFFRRLVGNLAASDPARLYRPLALDDITGSILPYRTNRRALQLDTSEEYELVLLRLCAGEGNLARAEPEEARTRFAEECRSANPDLDVLRQFEDVQVTLESEPLARALRPEPDPGFAPSQAGGASAPPSAHQPASEYVSRPAPPAPDPPAAPEPPAEEVPMDELDEVYDLPSELAAAEEALPACLYCGGSLPTHRPVNFCPHCGQSQTVILCAECRSEVEPGWRHCVNCGAAVGGVPG